MTPATPATDRRGLSVIVDLLWWGVVGVVIALGASGLGHSWGVRPPILAVLGAALALSGVPLWLWVRRTRPMPRAIIRIFAVANVAMTPAIVVLAAFRLLPLTVSGNAALWAAAAIVLGLGIWQGYEVRRPPAGR